jgi:hypothetical protein
MNRTITAMLALGVTLSSASAGATPQRSPLWSTGGERETELSLQSWDTPAVLERKRSFGRKFAVFHADPQQIAADAVLVFEVESQGEVRWSCVAVDDVAECLGAPVRVRYRKADETVRLRVKAVPRQSPRGNELVRVAKQARDGREVATR